MRSRLTFFGLAAVASSFLVDAPASAAGVATHAMIVSGQVMATGGGVFACRTSGPQAREKSVFGTGIGLPTEGYAFCSLSGGIDDQAGATGAVSTQAVTHAFNGGVHDATADARAGFTGLGVSATGSFTGSTNNAAYHAAEAAAYSSDSFLLPGSGIGSIQLGFTIDGSASSVGNSQTITYFNYQIGTGPSYTAFAAGTDRGTAQVIFPTAPGVSIPGFVTSGATLSGSAVAQSFLTPVTLGGMFDLNLGLYAASYPGSLNGVADNNFFSTARLTRIDLFDATGQAVRFSVKGASGTIYDNDGAHAAPVVGGVPEPTSWAMMLAGFGVVGAATRRRRSVAARSV